MMVRMMMMLTMVTRVRSARHCLRIKKSGSQNEENRGGWKRIQPFEWLYSEGVKESNVKISQSPEIGKQPVPRYGNRDISINQVIEGL